jgi:hypothetical protein
MTCDATLKDMGRQISYGFLTTFDWLPAVSMKSLDVDLAIVPKIWRNVTRIDLALCGTSRMRVKYD